MEEIEIVYFECESESKSSCEEVGRFPSQQMENEDIESIAFKLGLENDEVIQTETEIRVYNYKNE